MVTPAAKRETVAHLMGSYEMSERRACCLINVDRKTVRYRSRRPRDEDLRRRLKELAAEQRRFGYRRLHVLLRAEGHLVNRKKTKRLYREAFNGRIRDELLNETIFHDLAHAREALACWVASYNQKRPHSALGYLTPAVCARTFTATDDRLRNPDQLRRSSVASSALLRQSQPKTLASNG
jgi:Integrase core domain/HTH-like domain